MEDPKNLEMESEESKKRLENDVVLGLLNHKRDSKVQNDEALFDELMVAIGNNNRFQSRFNILYNLFLVFLVTMPYLNIILAMTVPDHWCFVPGRNETNYTLEEWKSLTLPKMIDPKTSDVSISKCEMLNGSEHVECQYGYEYSRQWYTETAPSQEDWVCKNEMYVTNTFVVGRIGEIIGTFVFGQMGDLVGRRPVFYVSMLLLVSGRIASALTAHNFPWFLVTICIGSMATTSVFQSPFVICMEVSAGDKRAHIAFMQCLGWVLGMCMLPLIAWLTKDWVLLMLVTTIPVTMYFVIYKLMPESPRWLASRGRIKESAKTLEYIAKVNGTKLPMNTLTVLQKIASKKERVYGIPSLFSSFRLAKNSLIIILCWVICGLSYYILVLNVSNMGGNPFLNFFLQSLVELPGYVLGRILSDRLGRRWTQVSAYFVACVSCCLVIGTHHFELSIVTTIFVSFIKLGVTTSFYMVWLQAMEIYPTCVRQTGTSIGGLVANIVGIGGPYIVYLGTTIDARLPYGVLLVMTFAGAVSAMFLPETYKKKLPETLKDAHTFGKDQKFWSFN